VATVAIRRQEEEVSVDTFDAIGKGTKDPWPKPGQLSLEEVVIENGF
jgi:hypothetical protein